LLFPIHTSGNRTADHATRQWGSCGTVLLSLLCAAAMSLSSASAFAQKTGGGAAPPPPKPTPPPRPPTDSFDENQLRYGTNGALASKSAVEKDTCFLPPLNGLRSPVVTVANLQAAAKAKKEYAAACAAVNDKKFDVAEQHLRKAVQVESKYPAAWVTLGQLLAAQQKTDEARQSCSRALEVDPNYVPSHLCMGDVAARAQQWDDVLKYAERALELDPTNDAPGYAYSAMANLNLHHLAEAEKNALRALEIDRTNSDPRVHFLLAQIYEAKKDPTSEASQLREYLKYASTPQEVAMVQQALADLEKRMGK